MSASAKTKTSKTEPLVEQIPFPCPVCRYPIILKFRLYYRTLVVELPAHYVNVSEPADDEVICDHCHAEFLANTSLLLKKVGQNGSADNQ